MPQEANKVHWYYALAVDKTGNWDRVPDPDAGNYAYFQTTFDVCGVTPRKSRTEVSATKAAGDIIVTWCAPTAYTNGDPIRADDALTYESYFRAPAAARGGRPRAGRISPAGATPTTIRPPAPTSTGFSRRTPA